MKKYILSCFLLLSVLTMQAQNKWTLRQCIEYAVENNIEIKQQALSVQEAEINVSTSKNSRLPDLNASLTPEVNFGRSTLASNVSESVSSLRTGFGISSTMPIFTGFKIPNQQKVDKLDLLAATEGLKKAKENMELNVTSLYLEVLFKKEILKIYQEQLALTGKQVEQTNILVEAGKVPKSQLFDIKAQEAKDEMNITVANNNHVLALLNLSQALNFHSADGFDVVEPNMDNVINNNLSSILPPDQVYQTALVAKPFVKESEYRVESSKKSLEVAKADYYPTVNLRMGYGTTYQHVFNKDNLSFGKQIRDFGSEYIGLSINIPIFNRFQVRNQVRKARLNIENRTLELDNVKLALYKEIQQSYQSAVAAQAKFVSTGKAFEAANESFTYAQERYNIGKSTVFEFNEAQTKLLTSKSEQVQAKYDFLFTAKILDFYRGVEINIK